MKIRSVDFILRDILCGDLLILKLVLGARWFSSKNCHSDTICYLLFDIWYLICDMWYLWTTFKLLLSVISLINLFLLGWCCFWTIEVKWFSGVEKQKNKSINCVDLIKRRSKENSFCWTGGRFQAFLYSKISSKCFLIFCLRPDLSKIY